MFGEAEDKVHEYGIAKFRTSSRIRKFTHFDRKVENDQQTKLRGRRTRSSSKIENTQFVSRVFLAHAASSVSSFASPKKVRLRNSMII